MGNRLTGRGGHGRGQGRKPNKIPTEYEQIKLSFVKPYGSRLRNKAEQAKKPMTRLIIEELKLDEE